MIVEEIKICDFRNYVEEKVSFKRGVNVIYGENGQGKTNLLEAIFYALTSQSFRKAQNSDLVREGAERGIVLAEFKGVMGVKRIARQVEGDGNTRTKVDGKEGVYRCKNVVCFTQEDLLIVKGEPQRRRDFVDAIMCQLDRVYENEISRYRKALHQRNELLKMIRRGEAQERELDAWEEILAESGENIVAGRKKILSAIEEVTDRLIKSVDESDLQIRYYPTADNLNTLREKLKRNRQKEIARGLTLIGPHRDEMVFVLNGRNLRTKGSQGQQRMTVILLKLCTADLLERYLGERGVVILDDFSSELDEESTTRIVQLLKKEEQAIVTTNRNRLGDFRGEGWFISVQEGRVSYGL